MGKSSGNTGTAPLDNSRSHAHKPRIAGLPGMTTETQMILRAAPDALGTAGPAEHDPDAPTPRREPTRFPEAYYRCCPEVEDIRFNEAHAEDDKTAASSKPATKKPAVKKPSAKQLPKKEDTTKETRRTPGLPPKRTDVLLPGPHQDMSSDSCDTDTPNPALVTGADPPVCDASQAPRAQTSTTGPASQVITNTGVDEGFPPELLRPENRQHLSDRSRQAASQTMGAKRELETPAPRTREQLLALRYWTRKDRLARQLSETEFEGWFHHLGYPEPEFLNFRFRIHWLAQRRRRSRMAKMIADDTWTGRFLERHKPMSGVIREEVVQKIQKSWQSQPIEPWSVLGPVDPDQVRRRSYKRPLGRRSPFRGEPQAPTSYDYSGSHSILVLTATSTALQ
ncbi:unnamed protein product [Phytophthora fragariaefolia]|uniref:Unnamed protein product n=1 Tax=Phytophthora fragariaefolia TaxID=1490495 RepID=A0A9W6TZQ4_9STRA|nr:unnamed protein product [Phytophthora fragariaefolia]